MDALSTYSCALISVRVQAVIATAALSVQMVSRIGVFVEDDR